MENLQNTEELTTEVEVTSIEATSELMMASDEAITEEVTAEEGSPEDSAPKITDEGEILQALEAVIFASPKAMTLVRLRNLLNAFDYDTSELPLMLNKLEEKFSNCGFQLVKVAGGYQLRTHPKNSDLLQKLLEDKPARLSPSALEVLAIVAYKQPVTRSEIDAVRGIDSGHLMRGLLEKNLVRTAGHAETPGRPLLYATTSYFLEVFSLGSLDELPATEEFQRELITGETGSVDSDGTLFAADPSLSDAAAFLEGRASPLGADPERGSFDNPAEEDVESADFGLAEIAREEALN